MNFKNILVNIGFISLVAIFVLGCAGGIMFLLTKI